MTTTPNLHLLVRAAAAACVAAALTAAMFGNARAAGDVAPPHGDPTVGQKIYQSCMGCHSLDANDVGPKHRGVVGRAAASVPGYAYSSALRKSGIVWSPTMLDRWLTNPQKLVPGARMYFSVANPQSRADIIAYLAQQR